MRCARGAGAAAVAFLQTKQHSPVGLLGLVTSVVTCTVSNSGEGVKYILCLARLGVLLTVVKRSAVKKIVKIMSAKNRWQAGGGKAVSAARACNNINAGGVQGVTDEQFQRAKITFVGLFIIMVTVWSGVLIGTIFSLRGTWDRCAKCPESCGCASPVWG